jgi:hypothetical protein
MLTHASSLRICNRGQYSSPPRLQAVQKRRGSTEEGLLNNSGDDHDHDEAKGHHTTGSQSPMAKTVGPSCLFSQPQGHRRCLIGQDEIPRNRWLAGSRRDHHRYRPRESGSVRRLKPRKTVVARSTAGSLVASTASFAGVPGCLALAVAQASSIHDGGGRFAAWRPPSYPFREKSSEKQSTHSFLGLFSFPSSSLSFSSPRQSPRSIPIV